jgi:hypothetical protein
MTFLLPASPTHIPPLSFNVSAEIPDAPFPGASTTRRCPALSNWIPRGFARPVATSPILYPDATLAENDGFNELEQLVCAEAKTKSMANAQISFVEAIISNELCPMVLEPKNQDVVTAAIDSLIIIHFTERGDEANANHTAGASFTVLVQELILESVELKCSYE